MVPANDADNTIVVALILQSRMQFATVPVVVSGPASGDPAIRIVSAIEPTGDRAMREIPGPSEVGGSGHCGQTTGQ